MNDICPSPGYQSKPAGPMMNSMVVAVRMPPRTESRGITSWSLSRLLIAMAVVTIRVREVAIRKTICHKDGITRSVGGRGKEVLMIIEVSPYEYGI
jgi:hypothetical protein